MNISNHTILITGGATGIGLELAKQLITRGNTVIVCGRRESKLKEARSAVPSIVTRQCDVSDMDQRRELYDFCISNYPALNILINNAGIQREIDFRKGEADYLNGESETAVNLEATFHLTALFTPHLMKQKESAIINVSSGLGIVPLVIVPVYAATKAALHSFSISLRKQLEKTSVKVFEILPPIVDTELDKGARKGRGQTEKGISPEIVAIKSLQAIELNQFEIPIGIVRVLRIGARISPQLFLKIINKRSPVQPV